MAGRPVINLDDVELAPHGHGETYEARAARLGPDLGLSKLGCRLVELAPAKRAWPYHLHHMNEEIFFILSGTGTLRFDGAEHPVRPGDVIGAPTGPDSAHQLHNSGTEPLRYLAISTLLYPEIAEYPDTGKFNAMTGPMTGPGAATFQHVGRRADAIDYWADED